MGINEIIGISHVHLLAPKVLCNGFLSQDAVFVRKKEHQEIEFFFCKNDLFLINEDLHLFRDDPDLIEDDLIGSPEISPADDGFDPGIQFGEMKWLGDVIIRTDVKPDDLVIQ